ncbi:MAG: type II toxin-antitoxin system death-on-curing family toxin [Candidatus Kapabacteria bacterium]|jgi:death-on-curing protein|nr:type II toxin-antitoxin system death-on-curing family toxin [Candidatus Kapabacteria bacterium]
MQFLTLSDILLLHQRLIKVTGGGEGIRDLAGLESAIAQPQMTFDEEELYPSLAEKASALMFSLVLNHPFVDGNKRVGFAAAELFLWLNGSELNINIDDAEQVILSLAAGNLERDTLTQWLQHHCTPSTK